MQRVWCTKSHIQQTVCSRDSVKSVDDDEQRLEHVQPALADLTMLVTYAGHVP